MRYISEIIDCRAREIVDAMLYYIQESGLPNAIRSGIVITGGGAELANFVGLVKEMSGYEVRKGYPRFMFSAPMGSGVYSTAATSALGMVLAAKDDRLPDCVSQPLKEEEIPEEELVELEVTDETSAVNNITDEEMESGETGNLISPEEFGEAVKKEKNSRKVKVKNPSFMSVAWKKMKDSMKSGALKIYDDATREENENMEEN